jgi:hypothetical protein
MNQSYYTQRQALEHTLTARVPDPRPILSRPSENNYEVSPKDEKTVSGIGARHDVPHSPSGIPIGCTLSLSSMLIHYPIILSQYSLHIIGQDMPAYRPGLTRFMKTSPARVRCRPLTNCHPTPFSLIQCQPLTVLLLFVNSFKFLSSLLPLLPPES